MKIHRFIGDYPIEYEVLEIRDDEVIHQIRDVLNLKKSEKIKLSDGRGSEATFELIELKREAIRCHRTSDVIEIEKPGSITLYCALLKNENFEWVIQKATELGVSKITPLITARTVKFGLRRERLMRIAREAAELAGRGLVPEITEAMEYEQALKTIQGNIINLFCEPSGHDVMESKLAQPLSIFIGPEGGWDDKEIEQARSVDFKFTSLSRFILRAETAATLAVAKAVERTSD